MPDHHPAADARPAAPPDPMLTSNEWDIVLDALLTEEGIARENARMWKGRSREDRYRREADEAVRIHDKLAAALAGRPAVPPDYVTPLNQPLPAMRWACGASASGFDLPSACPVHGASCDAVCEHGTALDVHCCNCHSGFIFDKDHECPPEARAAPAVPPPLTNGSQTLRNAGPTLTDAAVPSSAPPD